MISIDKYNLVVSDPGIILSEEDQKYLCEEIEGYVRALEESKKYGVVR